MCMCIIFDFYLGIVEKYCIFYFLGFFLCNVKKKILGNVRFIEDVFVIEKEIILNI